MAERDARPTQAAYDAAVATARTEGQGDVTGDPASYSLVTQASYDAVAAERDARPLDSDQDGLTDAWEAELETDVLEETVFYLQEDHTAAVAVAMAEVAPMDGVMSPAIPPATTSSRR